MNEAMDEEHDMTLLLLLFEKGNSGVVGVEIMLK